MNCMKIEFPEKLQFLFEPHRYKVMYGGRGGAKSWGIARALLVQGASKPLRILCTREFQSSIADSVHKLLSDQIVNLGLQDFYKTLQTSIHGKNGTEIVFAGLRHNINNLKSFEGMDIVWIEEAANTSYNSLKVLIPTIRKPGSEIWLSFNPELEDDPVYKRFVINPSPRAKVVEISWQDNPWFKDGELMAEMLEMKEANYQEYLHVYEGQCKQTVDGAVFGDQIREAVAAKRIMRVPYNRDKPVHTIWDLGRRDGTAIWFMQEIGYEFHFIDYHYDIHKDLPHHVKVLKDKPYNYCTHWLPHDAEYEVLGRPMNVKNQVQESFPNVDVRIVPGAGLPGSITSGIELARNIFPRCFFDNTNEVVDGVRALRGWHYKRDVNTGKISPIPVHDENSHGASAFMYFAMSLQKMKQAKSAPINYSNKGIV